MKWIDLPDDLRLFRLDRPLVVAYPDGATVPRLPAQFRWTSIQFVNEYTIATFHLTKGRGHVRLAHVRFDREPSSGRMSASWEAAVEWQRQGWAQFFRKQA